MAFYGRCADYNPVRAGDLMQDLKTGHLIRASPRAQFYGQLIGSFLSIIVTATAYTLYNRAYEIPGPSFPAPTAYVWLGLARLLRMLYAIHSTTQAPLTPLRVLQAMETFLRKATYSCYHLQSSLRLWLQPKHTQHSGIAGTPSGFLLESLLLSASLTHPLSHSRV